MAITRQKKEEILARVSSLIGGAGSIVFVGFHKLGVADTSEMRSALKEEGIQYTVAKKSLITRALDASSIEGALPPLEGEVALAYGEDLIAPARGVQTFVKKHKGALSILGGVFEGRYMSASEMIDIASIPSRDTLYAQLAMLINSPLQKLVVGLSEVAKKKEQVA